MIHIRTSRNPAMWCRVLAICAVVISGSSAHAFERLEGWFIAAEACPAYQSKNKATNPGDITLTAQRAYPLLGTNPPRRDWYQIEVAEAPQSTARWVPISCGTRQDDTPQASTGAQDLVLALTWQPAFCETRPNQKECRALNGGALRHASQQLSLHGLWPQPRSNIYCGVSARMRQFDETGAWHRLPAPELDADTVARLNMAMPGAASLLDRHEWIKHGTCYLTTGGADAYYDDSLALLAAINASDVGILLADGISERLTAAQIRSAFDAAFGAGAGARVDVTCRRDDARRLIMELRIHLRGTVGATPELGDLMRAAAAVEPHCASGIVDAAGLQ